jgi:hypothetical protein
MLRRLAIAALSIPTALGCSDPVPDPPQGAMQISFGSPEGLTGAQCPKIASNFNVGVPPPSKTNPGGRVRDGDGAKVNCAVRGSGTLSFDGSMTQGNLFFYASGSITEGGEGQAKLSQSDPAAFDTYQTREQLCRVFVNEGGLQVAPGRIYAAFRCDALLAKNLSSNACSADGVFVFENYSN